MLALSLPYRGTMLSPGILPLCCHQKNQSSYFTYRETQHVVTGTDDSPWSNIGLTSPVGNAIQRKLTDQVASWDTSLGGGRREGQTYTREWQHLRYMYM